MPVSPELGAAQAAGLVDLYLDSELVILQRIAKNLGKGLDAPDWATKKLAELQFLRAKNMADLAQLDQSVAREVSRKIATAYNLGTATAVGDLDNAGISPVLPAARERAVRTLVVEAAGNINAAHTAALRATDDVYRKVVAETAGQVLTGAATRRDVSQAVINRLLQNGLTGFTDKSGRSWTLDSYAEMTVRTAAGRASVQGHVDTLAASGEDLIMVNDAPRECPLCRPWEGKVLSISGATVGVIDGPDVKVAATLAQARAAGFQHPNCRHRVLLYQPGFTRALGNTEDPHAYEAVSRQREMERTLRQWKRREALALTPEEGTHARRKQAEWSAALDAHVARHGLKPAKQRRALTTTMTLTSGGQVSRSVVYNANLTPSDRTGKAVRAALQRINDVHSVPDDLPTVTMHRGGDPGDNMRAVARGKYHLGYSTITVHAAGDVPALTTVHEYGHYLDHSLFGDSGQLASLSPDSELTPVFTAIHQTDAYKNLTSPYLTSRPELFARAYAQWVAEMTGDNRLAREVALNRAQQWSRSDFAKVKSALTQAFRAKGLIR